jgi:eukaryotic-like serine/threonine-protein kinase
MLSLGTVLNGQWTIAKKIGHGSCGEVYTAREIDDDIGEVVIKVCRIPTGKTKVDKEQAKILGTLDWERNMYYNRLRNFKYAPSIPLRNGYGTDKGVRYIVMQKLDFSLCDLVATGQPVSKPVAARIGMEILEGLEMLHAMNFLFVDIKPDNFMILQDIKKSSGLRSYLPRDRLLFVDFGLVAKLSTVMGEGADRERTKTPGRVNGTPSFLSLDTLCGWSECRKDDVESLVRIINT